MPDVRPLAMSRASSTAAGASVALLLKPIGASASYRDQAYALLRQAISEADIYGQAEPIRLDEREIGLALGVSRTPVREAMTLLEREGFLRTVPRRGIFIVRKTRREIIEMIQMWAALESMAARLATLHAPDAEIAGLRRMFDEFRDAHPSRRLGKYSDTNIAFHQAIVRLGGSRVIADTVKDLFAHVGAIRRVTMAKGDRAARSIADHLNIVEALEKRETERAERLLRDHTLALAEYVRQHCDFLE